MVHGLCFINNLFARCNRELGQENYSGYRKNLLQNPVKFDSSFNSVA